ncbi:MAG: M15 family metallopeptidase [Ruminococcus sp.]|nr:M15 family metallopeptidase [Ruminococcus sp.]
MSYECETSCETATTENHTTQTTITFNTDVVSSGTTTSVSERKITVTTVETKDVPDGELVRILDYIPDAVIDLRYATSNNFTGTVIYDDTEAYLCYGTVKKLAKVQNELKEKGFSIIIWDAYRSSEAQYRLWEVCPNPTYVADPRNGTTSHGRGNTIDLGIVYADGSEVELPSGFDEFSLFADRDYSDVSEEAAENSRLLEKIMNTYGFNGYWGEWWHYSDENTYTLIIPEN